MSFDDWLIVIPARLASERLPQKPLLDLGGKPLIVRVFENLSPLLARGIEIIVAVDHELTAKTCADYKVPFAMTSPSHKSGTDRCAEVALKYPGRKYILNVQGDEPQVNKDDLLRLMEAMSSGKSAMATLGFLSSDLIDYQNPNIVKIALANDSSALYFSRAPIPFDRDSMRAENKSITFVQHLGVYAFTQDSLRDFCRLTPSPLEQTEKLEQLRALSAGWKIQTITASNKSIGIDTPEDLEKARKVFHG